MINPPRRNARRPPRRRSARRTHRRFGPDRVDGCRGGGRDQDLLTYRVCERRGVGVWLGLLDEEDGHAETTRVEEVRPKPPHVGWATHRRWGAVPLNRAVAMAVAHPRLRARGPAATACPLATAISTVEAAGSSDPCQMVIEAGSRPTLACRGELASAADSADTFHIKLYRRKRKST